VGPPTTYSLCATGATCHHHLLPLYTSGATGGATCSSSSSSLSLLLLLVTTHIGWPLNLYRFPSLTPRIIVDLKLDHLGTNNTCPSRNNMWYPFLSISETERTLLLSSGTHNTFDTLNTSPDSNQNDIVPDPRTACLVPIPSSTHKSEPVSVKVSNNSLAPVIWKDAPLSTNQVPLLETVPEREETNKISLWNLSATSSTSVVDACFLLPLPLWCGHCEA
jgi:hypothetical protein